MSQSHSDRQYDLVLWGATGFVGQLVAEHLTEYYTPDELSLALGGRDESRLQSLESKLVSGSSAWETIPVVCGDATDPESLHAITAETDVICTTVGPYAKYGTPLVEACIETGTDYCDLTGEVTWVREMVDRYHDGAVEAEVRIVHGCGFDSIPADLGTKLLQSYALEQYGVPCDLVRLYLEGGKGGVSGGTAASAVEMFRDAATDPIARQTLRNPYSLAPRGERSGPDPGGRTRPQRDSLRGEWTAPSPMGVVNERVIRRSNALLGYPWGREFECAERIPTGTGLIGAGVATAISAGLATATATMTFEPTRRLAELVLPRPGDGPTREQIENGYFRLRLLGRGTASDGPFVVESCIAADRDPGYGATALMLGETAMCLVGDERESPLAGGVLTPATGLGDSLADRLRDVGLTVDVGELGETRN